jgi:Flp pilus assembly protein TadG
MRQNQSTISDHMNRAMKRFQRNTEGVTAVEFGLVGLPFFMMLFGIMGVGFFFFTQQSLENAVWAASRDLKTGIFQTGASGSRYAGKTGDALKDEFKKAICEKTPNYVSTNCDADVRIIIQAYASATSNTANATPITKPACLANASTLVSEADAKSSSNAGGAGAVVLVTACYAFRLGGLMPFLKFGNMGNGTHLMAASAAFQSEPYAGS